MGKSKIDKITGQIHNLDYVDSTRTDIKTGELYIKNDSTTSYVPNGGGLVIEPYNGTLGGGNDTLPYARLMYNPEKKSLSPSIPPDVILSAHKYHSNGELHEHFTIYTSDATGSPAHRLDIDYLQDIANFDIQASQVVISPTFNSSTNNFRGLKASPTFIGTGAGQAAIEASATHAPATGVTSAYGFINITKGNPTAGATITNMYGGFNRIDTGSTSGVLVNTYSGMFATPSFGSVKPETSNGVRIQNQGSASISTTVGLDINAQTGSVTNIGARIAKGDTYALQLSDTGGTSAGGITFGTDTPLHRNAANKLTLGGDLLVDDEAYAAGWNGSLEVPTKNALYDKIETISASGISESLAIAYATAL